MFGKKKAKNNDLNTGMEIPEVMTKRDPEEEERMHEEELRRLMKGMDRKDLKIICEYIPYDLLLNKLNEELIEKDKWRIKIEEMYQQFSPEQTESNLKTQIIWNKNTRKAYTEY